MRNKLEPWTLQHNLSTSDDLVNIYNKCLEICPLSICPCFANDIWNKSYMNCGKEMKMKKWSSQWMQFMQLRKRSLKKIQDFYGFKPRGSPEFFQASLRNCINCVHCDDHFFIFMSLLWWVKFPINSALKESGIEAESFESWYSWFLSFSPQWFTTPARIIFQIHDSQRLLITCWLDDFNNNSNNE